ncbi:unnamed protein product [Lactuca saligna]|uniref:Calponin-homology (CH) domain-containing protein n=1 Tax=Lactuca saligna TaxID=75948 RepID=A0AA36A519_LACSI|nr:unnamed protein product [Lactuca saligna]
MNWEWKSTPRTVDQISEINMLTNTVGDYQLMDGRDKWRCTLSSDGAFHVDALRFKIDCWNIPLMETHLKWIHEIPLKVTCFIWRANLDRIPTACALLKRGIQLDSPICTYYRTAEEDISHVLLRCPMAMQDGEAYAYLLNVLAPEHSNPGTLDTKDPTKMENLVLEYAEKMDCKRYLAPKDIVEGSANLNLAFLAHIVQDSLSR